MDIYDNLKNYHNIMGNITNQNSKVELGIAVEGLADLWSTFFQYEIRIKNSKYEEDERK